MLHVPARNRAQAAARATVAAEKKAAKALRQHEQAALKSRKQQERHFDRMWKDFQRHKAMEQKELERHQVRVRLYQCFIGANHCIDEVFYAPKYIFIQKEIQFYNNPICQSK